MYFKVSEASALVGVPAYVLRFWETEFAALRPKRTPAGQRLYRQRDIALLRAIRHLLHERKFTIPGARLRLQDAAAQAQERGAVAPYGLAEIRADLQALRELVREGR
jgi:DNA-binding transcriptional MerR regulator